MSAQGAEVSPDGDWESLLDSGQLDQSLQKLTILKNPNHEKKDKSSTKNQTTSSNGDSLSSPSGDIQRPVTVLNSEGKPVFEAPEPKLKILRRPESQAGSKANDKLGPKHIQKTLEQREAEYAEARLRILGTDSESSTSSASATTPEKPRPNPPVQQPQQRPNNSQNLQRSAGVQAQANNQRQSNTGQRHNQTQQRPTSAPQQQAQPRQNNSLSSQPGARQQGPQPLMSAPTFPYSVPPPSIPPPSIPNPPSGAKNGGNKQQQYRYPPPLLSINLGDPSQFLGYPGAPSQYQSQAYYHQPHHSYHNGYSGGGNRGMAGGRHAGRVPEGGGRGGPAPAYRGHQASNIGR